MNRAINMENNPAAEPSDQRRTEINYHRKLNLRFVLVALPSFMFFAGFHFFQGNIFPGVIFSLLAVNAVLFVLLGRHTKKIKNLIRQKRVGSSIAFALLAAVIIDGLFSKDVYLAFPWIFIYPVAALLMFGERIGIFFASGFCLIIWGCFYFMDLPPWNMAAINLFKLSSGFALFSSLVVAQIAERTRVRMRNGLIEARNKYMAAEEQQRLTNEELKVEIDMRITSERLLSQSEIRYRALFEESAVSLWEENQAEVKTFLDGLAEGARENMAVYLRQHPDDLEKCVKMMRVTAVNHATLNLYEATDERELLSNIPKVLPEDNLNWNIARITALYRNGRYQDQVEVKTLKGRKLNLLVTSTVPVGYDASWEKIYTSVNDITERVTIEAEKKRVEDQAQHARQIQAIATLAGGIAHQFNNALAVIVGNLDLLEMKMEGNSDGVTGSMESLRKSSEHMYRLTRQLLAYAQGGKFQPTDVPAQVLIKDFLKSNKHLQASGIRFTTNFEKGVVLSGGDITQIGSVLEAALSNAVEATGDSGEITISACNLVVDKTHDLVRTGLDPGNYALITIEDFGEGMSEETRQRIFDPFFSTKFVGRGMGMAAAYGIVRNHNGMIEVKSKPGEGTRVMIYLPSV